jgi:hypothetical protein
MPGLYRPWMGEDTCQRPGDDPGKQLSSVEKTQQLCPFTPLPPLGASPYETQVRCIFMTRLSTPAVPPAPQHRRARRGAAVRVHLGDLVHPGHSFFASEDAARQRPNAHPDVHGITGRPAEMARMIAELGNGRLEYSCQPQVPLLTVMIQLSRMASPRPSPALRVPRPFWLPTPAWCANGSSRVTRTFFPLLLRLDPAMRTAASPARSAR